jgi:heme/copper-type cytochrome/quinol oxidase subunit 4
MIIPGELEKSLSVIFSSIVSFINTILFSFISFVLVKDLILSSDSYLGVLKPLACKRILVQLVKNNKVEIIIKFFIRLFI